MDVEVLISEVEKHPAVWDVSNNEYKNKLKRNEAWLRVASIVIPNFMQKIETDKKMILQEVISKWRSVRDNYIRSLRKRDRNNKLGTVPKRKIQYIYEEQLEFLKKCRLQEDANSNTEVVRNDLISTDSRTNITNGFGSIFNNEETNNESRYPRERAKRTNAEGEVVNFSEYKKNTNDDDDDVAFYKSTLPLIKTFNLEQKVQYRMQIMQLIQDVRNSSVQRTLSNSNT
ncbi:uncharacterized protein LOC126925413 [Bombus affinis]|uniref:uncharacterized protein LOC126925413 n=1 Tax=Bombus affinis TaxID=309941 RepID=UPI0021B7134A|nr:uncharacterized protein LOC126925413 [Bombus affinis]